MNRASESRRMAASTTDSTMRTCSLAMSEPVPDGKIGREYLHPGHYSWGVLYTE